MTNALSINTFCKTYGISRSLFYKLDKAGKAPRTMTVGRRRLISAEAAQEWRERMETVN
ncbi:MAG: transcriptional regulator [Verrucomicrobiae bacterium]|nr:transcriptional regulator [Verrucomicrobiae bacterium]